MVWSCNIQSGFWCLRALMKTFKKTRGVEGTAHGNRSAVTEAHLCQGCPQLSTQGWGAPAASPAADPGGAAWEPFLSQPLAASQPCVANKHILVGCTGSSWLTKTCLLLSILGFSSCFSLQQRFLFNEGLNYVLHKMKNKLSDISFIFEDQSKHLNAQNRDSFKRRLIFNY